MKTSMTVLVAHCKCLKKKRHKIPGAFLWMHAFQHSSTWLSRQMIRDHFRTRMGSKTRADAQLLEDLCTFLKGPGFLPWLPSHFRVSGMPLQYENSAHTAMQPQQNSRCSFPENPPHAEQHSFHENQECLYLAKSVTETAPVGTWEEIISDYFRTLIAFLQQQVMIRQLRFLLWTTAVSLKCPSLKSKEVPLHWLRVATHTQELAPRTASVARDIYSAAILLRWCYHTCPW